MIPLEHEASLDKTESLPAEQKEACEIAAKYRYEQAVEVLIEQNLLESQIERVKNQYAETLESTTLELSEDDWQMFTILELYDKDTAEHSVRVFENAYKAIQRTLILDDGSEFYLQTYLEEEGVSEQDFLHAALFHDIGKTIVPLEVLNNPITKEEFNELFCSHVTTCDSEWLHDIGITPENDSEDMLNQLYEKHKRPIDVLPLKVVISPEKFLQLQQSFPYIEINDDTTMRDIIELHESESERILIAAGLEIAGIIAGQHHNYAGRPLIYPRATSALRISRTATRKKVASAIQIIDVSDAIRNARSYKESQTEFTVLEELIANTKAGKLDSKLAYAWIKAEYENIVSTLPAEFESDITEDQKANIVDFLSSGIDSTGEIE